MNTKKTILFISLSTVAAVVLAGQAARPLFVNGKKSDKPVIEQNGEIYVPVSALKAAGADVSVDDKRVAIQFKPMKTQDEQKYVEGVLGEYVTNESWRIKVTDVKEITNPINGKGKGFELTFEVRNATPKANSLHGSGLQDIQLIDENDTRLAVAGSSFKDRYASVQPGGSFVNTLRFGGDTGATGKPAKLIVTFRPFGSGKPLTAIRIDLMPDK